MGIFTSGILGDALKGIFNVVDDLHTSPEEKSEAKFRISQLAAKADLAQMAVNAEEAKSGIMFVSGWRPYIGWVCGTAFAYNYILYHLILSIFFYIGQFTGVDIDPSGLPKLNTAEMMPVLMGMLGLGGLRTWEKHNGVARGAMAVEDKEPSVKRSKLKDRPK